MAEAASAADSSQARLNTSAAVSEQASAASECAVQVLFSGTIQEFVAIADTLTAVKVANVSVTGIQLLVSIGDTLVWATINDNQNANWQNIVDAQNAGWVVISNPSSPGWNDIPS
jgi:hypothetical protein